MVGRQDDGAGDGGGGQRQAAGGGLGAEQQRLAGGHAHEAQRGGQGGAAVASELAEIPQPAGRGGVGARAGQRERSIGQRQRDEQIVGRVGRGVVDGQGDRHGLAYDHRVGRHGDRQRQARQLGVRKRQQGGLRRWWRSGVGRGRLGDVR